MALHLNKNTSGFTLIEMMAALVVFASGVGLVVASSQSYVRSTIGTKLKIAEHSTAMIHKSNLLRGLNPEELNMLGSTSREMFGESLNEGESRMEYENKVVRGKATITWAERGIEGVNTEPAGHMIYPGSSGAAAANALEAPTLKYAGGVIDPSWFPSSDFVGLPSSNPSGTTYHFTQDGTDPDEFSSSWGGSPVVSGVSGGVTISDDFRIMAYHPDPMYGNSAITIGMYSAPTLAVTMSRTDGGNSLQVNYNEIADSTNRLVLSDPFDSSFGRVYYVVNDNREPSSSDLLYSGDFHLPHSQFDSSGAIITAKYVVLNPYFENPSYQVFNLQVEKLDLPMPVLDYSYPFFSGDRVRVLLSGDNANDGVVRNEHGEPASDPDENSSSTSNITINFN